MKQRLPEQFTYDRFQFRRLAREGDILLLEKWKIRHLRPGYEVVIVQCHPARNIHGREYPERESMPPPESWGIWGWSFVELDPAKVKFAQLVGLLANSNS